MNKYEVKTDIFANINKGEAITLDSRYSIWLDEDGALVFDDPTLVHRNPQWFKKIEEPEVKEGQYWEIEGNIYRVMKSRGNDWDFMNIRSGYRKNPNGYWVESNARKLSAGEIKDALIEEAKRRGYKPGKNIVSWIEYDDSTVGIGTVEGFEYQPAIDCLALGHTWIYKQGQWAEIIADEWKPVQFDKTKKYKVETEDRRIMGVSGKRLNQKEAEAICNALNSLDNESQ